MLCSLCVLRHLSKDVYTQPVHLLSSSAQQPCLLPRTLPPLPPRVNPSTPHDLHGAGVAHGSAGQLVTQAITTAVPCTRGCARSAGQALIASQVGGLLSQISAF